jgi:Cu/Ag efflux pump CusA
LADKSGVRPKMTTFTALMAGLLPILWGTGTDGHATLDR